MSSATQEKSFRVGLLINFNVAVLQNGIRRRVLRSQIFLSLCRGGDIVREVSRL